MSAGDQVRALISDGQMSGRMWMYSNYHCNLACAYCLTESSPKTPPRRLGQERMVALAKQAQSLGFTGLGVTGGEPFLEPDMTDTLLALSEILPVVVLTNGMLFHTPARMDDVSRLAGRPVRIQISLDAPTAEGNDALRGQGNFKRVQDAVPELVRRGLHVRIATTGHMEEDETSRSLDALVAGWGIKTEDHLKRALVDRGRAGVNGLGEEATLSDLPAELTLTAAGSFWSPFAPTYRSGKLQKDLMLTSVIDPVERPVSAMLGLLSDASFERGEARSGFV